MADIENINRRVFGGSHLVFREDHLNEVPRQIIWDLLEYVNTQTSSQEHILVFSGKYETRW